MGKNLNTLIVSALEQDESGKLESRLAKALLLKSGNITSIINEDSTPSLPKLRVIAKVLKTKLSDVVEAASQDGAQLGQVSARLDKGQPLNELVKGSLEYLRYLIKKAFYLQFRDQERDKYFFIEEIFEEYGM